MTFSGCRVSNLTVGYRSRSGMTLAVDDVSFEIGQGEIVGIVGESGCGKSTLASAMMRLLPRNAEILGGSVVLNGANVLEMSEEQLRGIRGSEIGMISQDPL